MKLQLPSNVTRTFYKVGFNLKKHSPEILIVSGVVGGVAAAVMACKATLKVNTITEEAKTNIEKIHTATETGITEAGEVYTPEDSKKDLTIAYTQTALKLVRLYGPAVVLGGLSITAILSGYNITKKRYVATAAAYTALDNSFKEYRGRLIDRFGEELDKELKYNIKSKEVEEIVVNEDGTEAVVKKTVDVVDVADPNNISPYARFFDDGCTGWDKNPETSLWFLKLQQDFANEKLRRRGYLFLNEVYEMLGIPRSSAGCVVGWIYDEKCPNGDNFVDFGIFDVTKPKNRDFVNGYERAILLDFNVDGDIQHMMH